MHTHTTHPHHTHPKIKIRGVVIDGQNRGGSKQARETTRSLFYFIVPHKIDMKFTIAVLSLATTASAFTPSVSQTRSVARTVGGGSSVLAPVPVRAAGT